MSKRHRVILIGGGLGGLRAARALKSAPVDVTLIDRRNYHLFQPLLYQVATGSLSPGQMAAPLRSVPSRQRNTRVLMVILSAEQLLRGGALRSQAQAGVTQEFEAETLLLQSQLDYIQAGDEMTVATGQTPK
jgi:glycine/D-amino acid oxidase-like deaminating enzyme